jgi:hypothetical protein
MDIRVTNCFIRAKIHLPISGEIKTSCQDDNINLHEVNYKPSQKKRSRPLIGCMAMKKAQHILICEHFDHLLHKAHISHI